MQAGASVSNEALGNVSFSLSDLPNPTFSKHVPPEAGQHMNMDQVRQSQYFSGNLNRDYLDCQ